ncbi:3-keto-5-aminohexanoate cleavage protein [Rhodobacteraceae bacterium M385]|nr:3-keto-5-aminohexanoate cleavage protein [Rhodobacteraceae bacterium M385]
MSIIVAPNGAYLTKDDHPAIPTKMDEIVSCAAECFAEGADALHAHVRDISGNHSLDIGQYSELLSEMARVLPDMAVQISTALGNRYTPSDQRRLLYKLQPARASIALREQLADDDLPAARVTYFSARDQGTEVQHVLYSPGEVAELEKLQDDGVIPKGILRVLFVLGRDSGGKSSTPGSIDLFLSARRRPMSWAVAAFGRKETECLVAAAQKGGAMRLGFENNRLNQDGTMAGTNAARVADLFHAIGRAKVGQKAS